MVDLVALHHIHITITIGLLLLLVYYYYWFTITIGFTSSLLFWLVVWNMNFIFPFIENVIIPTDELIFFIGVGIPPTGIGLLLLFTIWINKFYVGFYYPIPSGNLT